MAKAIVIAATVPDDPTDDQIESAIDHLYDYMRSMDVAHAKESLIQVPSKVKLVLKD